MTRLQWDAPGERQFSAGVDRGVLYPMGKSGVPWNGLVKVSETPVGGTAQPRYRDGVMVANPASTRQFSATLSAFTYPTEFEECDGTAFDGNGLLFDMQDRKNFNLSWRTMLGNDVKGIDAGYRIHLLYNALAAPSPMDYSTLSNQSVPGAFSWALTAKPAVIPGRRSTPHLIIDSTRTNPQLLRYVEEVLYGSDGVEPHLPSPYDLAVMFSQLKFFRVDEAPNSGITELVESDPADVFGRQDEGLYSQTEDSRLEPTKITGLYLLEQ